ncbi:MAG: hypothetical protein J6W64_04720 [Bacilli bacterium]|nr:hypothetical protein [Bacilli bacterium]
MKAISEIGKHSECLAAIFEDLTEDSEYGDRMGNRKHYDDDDMYGSRYGMRGSRRRY